MTPEPWEFVLLALAAFRVWKLLAEDAITVGVRARVFGNSGRFRRHGAAGLDFLLCPWCAGFWIAVGWWAAWLAWPEHVLVAAVPFALSAAVGASAVVLDRLSG